MSISTTKPQRVMGDWAQILLTLYCLVAQRILNLDFFYIFFLVKIAQKVVYVTGSARQRKKVQLLNDLTRAILPAYYRPGNLHNCVPRMVGGPGEM